MLKNSSENILSEKIGIGKQKIIQTVKKTFGEASEVFLLTAQKFFAKLCNEIGTPSYKGQKDKQSRKGQAESTAT